jgi:SAM-dependent methyltransferase
MFAIRQYKTHLAFTAGLALAAGLAFWTTARGVEKDVPYVPTPEEVVDKMLELAAPKKGEVLYDLGCGDGRIVVTAAKKYGVKGTGVDIDPERIADSNKNAKAAGVTDQVKFVEADLFKMDFHDADIVALYLLTSVNEKLKPRLLDQLRPGARVVSHAFSMGDWEPEQEVTVEPEGQTVYFWIVPAKVEGTWKLSGGKGGTLELKQKYQQVTGTATIDGKRSEIKDGKLNGAELTFTLAGADGNATKHIATVDGDTMKGKMGEDKGTEFTAKREGGGAAKKDSGKKEEGAN